MTNSISAGNRDAVTKADAIKFLECAVRNWSHVPRLSADDIEDVRRELEFFARHRTCEAPALASNG